MGQRINDVILLVDLINAFFAAFLYGVIWHQSTLSWRQETWILNRNTAVESTVTL